jgi:ribosomal protein S18 acetylase RimI-like enzyme
MGDRCSIRLKAAQIELDSAEFQEICGWPFVDERDAYVNRMLRNDIPKRKEDWDTEIWAYRDPNGELVGFGTIDLCTDYADYADDRRHPYIPLLAVKPSKEGRGIGTKIVQHRIAQAVILVHRVDCSDVLFLDVYEDKENVIRLYEKPECGFEKLPRKPIPDDRENNRTFIIMTKSLAVARL